MRYCSDPSLNSTPTGRTSLQHSYRGIIIAVRAFRVILTILYASYLTNVGLLLMLLPWSNTWSRLVLVLSPQMGFMVDSPVFRGMVSAFGFLHLALLIAELLAPGRLHETQPSTEPRRPSDETR